MSENSLYKSATMLFDRRQILKAGLVAALVCLNPVPAMARFTLLDTDERSLSLLNTHTGEGVKKLVYFEQGVYLEDALQDINYLLRDHRTDEVHDIDPITIDVMTAISRKVGATKPFEIVSGYRSPETNALLRKRSRRVAVNSYHVQGRAVDLRIPGVPLKVVRKAALELRMGGVGYYPKSNFVHVDSGLVRSW